MKPSIDNCRTQFEKQLDLLKINKIVSLSCLNFLLFQFINNMQVCKVFDTIIMKMDHDNTFYAGLNWKEFSMKAKTQIYKLYQNIPPTHDILTRFEQRKQEE